MEEALCMIDWSLLVRNISDTSGDEFYYVQKQLIPFLCWPFQAAS